MSDAPGQFADAPLIAVILDALDDRNGSPTRSPSCRGARRGCASSPSIPHSRGKAPGIASQRRSTRTDAPQASGAPCHSGRGRRRSLVGVKRLASGELDAALRDVDIIVDLSRGPVVRSTRERRSSSRCPRRNEGDLADSARPGAACRTPDGHHDRGRTRRRRSLGRRSRSADRPDPPVSDRQSKRRGEEVPGSPPAGGGLRHAPRHSEHDNSRRGRTGRKPDGGCRRRQTCRRRDPVVRRGTNDGVPLRGCVGQPKPIRLTARIADADALGRPSARPLPRRSFPGPSRQSDVRIRRRLLPVDRLRDDRRLRASGARRDLSNGSGSRHASVVPLRLSRGGTRRLADASGDGRRKPLDPVSRIVVSRRVDRRHHPPRGRKCLRSDHYFPGRQVLAVLYPGHQHATAPTTNSSWRSPTRSGAPIPTTR